MHHHRPLIPAHPHQVHPHRLAAHLLQMHLWQGHLRRQEHQVLAITLMHHLHQISHHPGVALKLDPEKQKRPVKAKQAPVLAMY